METGDLKLSDDGITVVFSVKLEPGKTYRFSLWAVVSRDGYAPIPTVLAFTTGT